MFYVSYPIYTLILSFQGGLLTVHVLGCELVFAQAVSKRGVWGFKRGSSIPFTYLGLALDSGAVQSSNLVGL